MEIHAASQSDQLPWSIVPPGASCDKSPSNRPTLRLRQSLIKQMVDVIR